MGRGIGVDADHEHYSWWALSGTSLGMLLATINSGTLIIALPDLERALHTEPALARLGDPRLHDRLDRARRSTAGRLSDLFGRKKAYVGGVRRVRARLARRRLLGSGTAADPVADRAGHRRRVPVRQRGRARDRRLPEGAARPRDGDEHDGRRRRAGASARCSAARWSRSLALGVLVQRAARARPARSGAGSCCASWRGRTRVRGFDLLGTATSWPGSPGSSRRLPRRPRGWDDPLVIGGLVAAAVLLPLWVLIERHGRAPMLDLDDLREPPLRRRLGRRVHQRPVALRAAVRVRLLLPGRAGRRPDHRRHQAGADGARDARRLAARRHLGRPPRLAHARRAGHARLRRRRWRP